MNELREIGFGSIEQNKAIVAMFSEKKKKDKVDFMLYHKVFENYYFNLGYKKNIFFALLFSLLISISIY